ncbi:MAG: DUF2339 domain-containing protein, partial [Burkholderiales bacterium]
MRLLAATVIFVLALIAKAPFFWALVLGIVAAALVSAWEILTAKKSGQSPPAQPVRAVDPPAPSAPRGYPDVSDPAALRTYLLRLVARIHRLEEEVAALKGQAPVTAGEARKDEPALELPSVEPVPMPEPERSADAMPAMTVTPAPEVAEPEIMQEPPAPPESVPGHWVASQPEELPREDVEASADTAHTLSADTPAEPLAKESPDAQPPAREPAGPSLFSRLVSGNIVAKAGAIILFFGVGFLLKFAYDHSMFPPQARLAGVALAAVGVFIFGWKLKDSRRLYGLILQGVASGLAYLTVFFALKTYGFIGVAPGFVMFAMLGAATTLLAVRQDAKPLAVLGLTGAFMAPILASTGGGHHVFLFSYYLLLNAFILAVSWFKSWRVLNLTGWFFTFGIAAAWGSRSYTPEMFGTVEPFLIAYFVMYLVIPVLFALRQPPELKGLVDGTLVFGTPAAAAVMQAKLVWDMSYGLAWSAALGAALYAALALAVLWRENMRLLGLTYVALAVGLGTLAIAFAFGAYTTFALWTIEGTAILWVCLRQKNLFGRMAAILVQGAGAFQFFMEYDSYSRLNPWFNDAVLGCAIIAVAAFISAVLYRKNTANIASGEEDFTGVFLVWGALCFSLGGLDAIHHGVNSTELKTLIAILFFSGAALAAEWLGARSAWGALRGLTVAHPLILAAAAIIQIGESLEPLAGLGWLAWPLGLGSLFWALHRQRRDGFNAALAFRYAGAWLVLAGVATWQEVWYLGRHEYLQAMVFALVGYLAAAIRFRLREQGNENFRMSLLGLLWATYFWFAAGLLWIHRDVSPVYEAACAIVFATASALAVEYAGSALRWTGLRSMSLVHS